MDNRDDFYWTLASVFLDRREQFEVFDQAFHVFWRDPQLLERVMALLLPRVHGRSQPSSSRRSPTGWPTRCSRRARARDAAPTPGADRARRHAHLLRAGAAADDRLRDHDGGGADAGEEADRRGCACRSPRYARAGCSRIRAATASICAHAARERARQRRPRSRCSAARRAASSAAGRPVRHLRLDEPLLAHVPALPACDHQRPRPRAHLRVRHAPHQHHAPPAPPRRGRRVVRGRARRSRTGRAARASAPASRTSTCAGRGACWVRTPWCC